MGTSNGAADIEFHCALKLPPPHRRALHEKTAVKSQSVRNDDW